MSINIVSVVIITVISQLYYTKEVEKNFFALSYDAVFSKKHQLDLYFKQVIQSTSSLLNDDLVQRYLTNPDKVSADDINDLRRALSRYVALNYSEIIDMFLVPRQMESVVSLNGPDLTTEPYKNEPWFNCPPLLKPAILATHRISYANGAGTYAVSLVMPIFSTDTTEHIGYLVVDLSLSQIQEMFEMDSAEGEAPGVFLVVAADDTVVYHPERKWMGAARKNTDLVQLNINYDKASLRQWQGEKWLIALEHSELTQWTIVLALPFREMAGGLQAIQRAIFISFIIVTLLIMIVIPLLANSFMNPLLKLAKLMRIVAKGNLDEKADLASRHYEFKQLGYNFDDMISQIKELMEEVTELQVRDIHSRIRQKEALIQALQNQINPHLLYNSLDIIKSMAYLEDMPVIEKMALNLGDVYRYTAKISDDEVTLQEELDHLTKYLDIIRLRFPGSFQSRIYINENFLDCSIIRLTLQPIVENAVKYAVEPRGGHGAILVSAYQDKSDMIIEIADNGEGFPANKLQQAQDLLEGISSQTNDFTQQDSLGISNVHARLVLKYGSRYGIHINSFPGRGCVISVRVPYTPVAETMKFKK
ncbi:cache domain-containing sensor histidine kinase [Paenibacillus sp. GM2]|uniref:cache domain-containing sensor histidine kinase n=1 Tax=Paenibacillus sp. GM2 TaxID=1622070 RepID=UPI001E4D6FB5|nr:sensor histidine kinase [Paenibacillus sp. GM2]